MAPYPSFNKFDNIVYKLFYLQDFRNETLMLDFNDPTDMVLKLKSTITLFGLRYDGMKFGQ